MGMDLIGFHVKGPTVITQAQQAEAKQHLERILAFCNNYFPDPGVAAVRAGIDALPDWQDWMGLPPDALDYNAEDCWARIHELTGTADVLLKDFMEFWKDGARDADIREDPDDKTSVMVFAGEGSWGDPPSGWGYGCLEAASMLGLFPIFNIR